MRQFGLRIAAGVSLAVGYANRCHNVIWSDLLDHLDAFRHLSEDCVNAVQVARIPFAQNDEKLAAAGVLSGMCHGERAKLVLVRISAGFARDFVARSTGPHAPIALRQVARERIAALNHKIRDNAMKLHAVVKLLVRQLLKIAYGLGSVSRKKLSDEGPAIGFESCQFGHGKTRVRVKQTN